MIEASSSCLLLFFKNTGPKANTVDLICFPGAVNSAKLLTLLTSLPFWLWPFLLSRYASGDRQLRLKINPLQFFFIFHARFAQGSSWLLQTSSRFAAYLYHRGINLAFMYIALASALFITILLNVLFFEKILEALLNSDGNLSGEDRNSNAILVVRLSGRSILSCYYLAIISTCLTCTGNI